MVPLVPVISAFIGVPDTANLPTLVKVDFVVIASTLIFLAGCALLYRKAGVSGSRVGIKGLTPRLHPLQAFLVFDHLCLIVAPAAAAALVFSFRAGEVGSGIWMFLSIALIGAILAGDAYPMHLMTWARRMLHVLAPVFGISMFLLSEALGAGPVFLEESVAALAAAIVVRGTGALIRKTLESGRPLRLAVIGASELACHLDLELRQSGVYKYKLVGFIGTANAS